MPRQNRVTPFGELIVTSARGRWMGNRGCLHDGEGRLLAKRWARKPWITCEPQFKGRKRSIMAPGQYTELFFLDEATAFAAGHRPCAECRREAYNRFKSAWLAGNPGMVPGATMKEIDEYLHQERVDSRTEAQRTWQSPLSDLPVGVLVRLAGSQEAWLTSKGGMRQWSPFGYTDFRIVTASEQVPVLTPKSICRALAAGYSPQVHHSAVTGR
jgi:hypothetical protein